MLRIFLELLPVVPVLAKGPHCHLVHASSCEHQCWEALGHEGEGEPGQEFIGVVGAGDKIEESRQGISIWTRNLPHCRSWRTQIAQIHVNGEVSQFANLQEIE